MKAEDLCFNIYGCMHKYAKKIMKKSTHGEELEFYYYYHLPSMMTLKGEDNKIIFNELCLGKPCVSIKAEELFYGENASYKTKTQIKNQELKKNTKRNNAPDAWKAMIENAKVPNGWKNAGFYLTGYILEKKQWVLSSWIWTSAAIGRYFHGNHFCVEAKDIADAFLRHQEAEGGWIVRHDYESQRIVPMMAPNDSAYICTNSILPVYIQTREEKYLEAAEKCAKWIIQTARADGLVYLGKDMSRREWITNKNIVDIGFTGGFFARLYEITGNQQYYDFLKKFEQSYLKIFFDGSKRLFHTSINKDDKGIGGYFARGQAWALEGLIPSYLVLKDEKILKCIEATVESLIANQKRNGAWSYNFQKPLMGEDCKGISVIARNLLEYYKEIKQDKKVINCVEKAIKWCENHTMLSGECAGGIFSYSVEGSVVHDLYSSTAFTYASAYALETKEGLNMIKGRN